MSNKGSAEQTGGKGTNYEQWVQTAFLVTLIIRGKMPGFPTSQITKLAFQTIGQYDTNDILVVVESQTEERRLLIECKDSDQFRFTKNNTHFKKVLNGFWKDYNNSNLFNKAKDRLLLVKRSITKAERSQVQKIFSLARSQAAATDFISKVERSKSKKKNLDVFQDLLKEVNNNENISDDELWEFLKCVDLLEYDFLNDSSVAEAYFLSLIKPFKSPQTSLNEKEIWNNVLAYVSTSNWKGASITLESIRNEDFYKNFDNAKIHSCKKAVEKLKSDSQSILDSLTNKIGETLHLPKLDEMVKILESININQITVVTGKRGVGKSSIIKEVLEKDLPNASTFVFRADEFSQLTIANTLSSRGVNETIEDIFSCLALIPEKIIFVDSLEKLLEADRECAFIELLELVKNKGIKLICSCRRYALELIKLKFKIND